MRQGEKSAMVRIAVRDGQVLIDFDNRVEGRGGYLHRQSECLDRFVKSKVKEFRSLRRPSDRQERVQIAEVLRSRLDSSASLE